MNLRSTMLAAAGILGVVAVAAYADGIYPGFPLNSSSVLTSPMTGNETTAFDTHLPNGAVPQTVNVPSALLMNFSGTPRNFLGNSSFLGTQVNGTGTVTGATTSAGTTAALGADRWLIDTNVGSGAGQSAIVTSSPAPPSGFTQSMKIWRNSGALTQPVCAWSAVPTPQATQLQGQTVTFSVFAAALAGLAADNGNSASLVIITGTGTDQGWNGSWTASPAITPAWTGIATVVTTPITLTTNFARFSTTAALSATETEIGVGVCFTPTATGSGATDGLAFVGAQLERAPSPSPYEVRPRQTEILDNEQFVYAMLEGAALQSRSVCHFVTANTGMVCPIVFPVPMYKAPAMTYATGFAGFTTTAETTANACTTGPVTATSITFVTSQYQVMVLCTIASGTTAAVGLSMTLADNGGTGKIIAWTGL